MYFDDNIPLINKWNIKLWVIIPYRHENMPAQHIQKSLAMLYYDALFDLPQSNTVRQYLGEYYHERYDYIKKRHQTLPK